MVETSLSGSGEGPGWATAPAYSTAAFWRSAQAWASSDREASGAKGPLAGRTFDGEEDLIPKPISSQMGFFYRCGALPSQPLDYVAQDVATWV